ncbi:4563_t:CDS:1 [Paraglomus occultum]|uniref:4563_t:CDS:1 n=1 Tax=Paraglomus occultum TaxID=144539 RepID=A0A9N8ZRD5_9GLOM|nr:4563_t:CDS:1 [Paraglomus occultum]
MASSHLTPLPSLHVHTIIPGSALPPVLSPTLQLPLCRRDFSSLTQAEMAQVEIKQDNTSKPTRVSSRVIDHAPLSPLDFYSSPASYSSGDEDTTSLLINEHISKSILSSTQLPASPACSTPVRTPSPSPSVSTTPRRSARIPKHRRLSKEEIIGRPSTGPAMRTRGKDATVQDDDERIRNYYEQRAAPTPPLAITYPRAWNEVDIGELSGVCGSKNFSYPTQLRSDTLSLWPSAQRKHYLAMYLRHGKDFGAIGSECGTSIKKAVQYYYLTKHKKEFKIAKLVRKEMEEYERYLMAIDEQKKRFMKTASANNGKKGRKKKGGRH